MEEARGVLAEVLRASREMMVARLRLLRLLSHIGNASPVCLGMFHLIGALAPVGIAVSSGYLANAAVQILEGEAAISTVTSPLLMLIGCFVLVEIADSGVEISGLAVASGIDRWLRRGVRELMLSLRSISHLEEPGLQNDLHLVSDSGSGRRQSAGLAATAQVMLTFRVISALLASAVIAYFSVFLAFGLLLASLAARAIIRRQWLGLADVYVAQAEVNRRITYLTELAGGAAAAKEVRMFRLAEWLAQRRRSAVLDQMATIWSRRSAVMRQQWIVVILVLGSAFAALTLPHIMRWNGDLDIGGLVSCMMAGFAVLSISSIGNEPFDIEKGTAIIRAFDRIVHAVSVDTKGASVASIPNAPVIRFEGVGFAYRGGQPVLRGLDLEVANGEVVALVGVNGVGKTTLVKLLSGLYTPTAGRITADGVDVSQFDQSEWRSKLAVIFQDYIHYPGTVLDNVTLSAPEHQHDREGARSAIALAGADSLVESLRHGLDTVLWRGAFDGAELSGGQWQKIAIARSLFAVTHGRQIIVLDEPTAHLDVSAEIEFFERLSSTISRRASIVLISHRLSTIRRADRILLLSDGRICESGTHEQLLLREGEYARLFRLQAARFSTGESSR